MFNQGRVTFEQLAESLDWNELLALDDEQLGLHVLAFWLARMAETKGLPLETIDQTIAEIFVESTVGMDEAVGGDLAIIEKALRKIATGQVELGGSLFRELIHKGATSIILADEAVTGRRRQKRNASRSRGDALARLIERIVGRNPNITAPELELALAKDMGRGVIHEISDGNISWADGDGPLRDTPISGLKDRLARAKRKGKSR